MIPIMNFADLISWNSGIEREGIPEFDAQVKSHEEISEVKPETEARAQGNLLIERIGNGIGLTTVAFTKPKL